MLYFPDLCFIHCLVGATLRVETDDIDRGGREHREVKVVRYNPLVVLQKRPFEGHPLSVVVEHLVGLLRPREKEAARAPVFQTVVGSAAVKVGQPHLYGS